MNLPIDTCENGSCAFAIRGEYDKRVYAKNLGLGGAFPSNVRVRGVSTARTGARARLPYTTTKRGGATFSARGRARCWQRPSS